LRRQTETIKLRRSLAKESESGKKVQQSEKIKPYSCCVEPPQTDEIVIHENEKRLQLIKSRPQSLAADNMNYEDLEELRKDHKEKIAEIEEQYSRIKGSSVKFSPEKVQGLENIENLSYEEMSRLRVFLIYHNNKKGIA